MKNIYKTIITKLSDIKRGERLKVLEVLMMKRKKSLEDEYIWDMLAEKDDIMREYVAEYRTLKEELE